MARSTLVCCFCFRVFVCETHPWFKVKVGVCCEGICIDSNKRSHLFYKPTTSTNETLSQTHIWRTNNGFQTYFFFHFQILCYHYGLFLILPFLNLFSLSQCSLWADNKKNRRAIYTIYGGMKGHYVKLHYIALHYAHIQTTSSNKTHNQWNFLEYFSFLCFKHIPSTSLRFLELPNINKQTNTKNKMTFKQRVL